jgi:hypothetical protein
VLLEFSTSLASRSIGDVGRTAVTRDRGLCRFSQKLVLAAHILAPHMLTEDALC